jgi:hypothetical protein
MHGFRCQTHWSGKKIKLKTLSASSDVLQLASLEHCWQFPASQTPSFLLWTASDPPGLSDLTRNGSLGLSTLPLDAGCDLRWLWMLCMNISRRIHSLVPMGADAVFATSSIHVSPVIQSRQRLSDHASGLSRTTIRIQFSKF